MKQHDFNSPCVSTPQGGEPPMTRAEVLAARKGYAEALHIYAAYGRSESERRAATKYPLPKKIVPREASVNGSTYRFVDGQYEVKLGTEWVPSIFLNEARTREHLAEVLALKDNPTCEVEV